MLFGFFIGWFILSCINLTGCGQSPHMGPKKGILTRDSFDHDLQNSEVSYHPEEAQGGESVKVALRIRPMNNIEISRRDSNCLQIVDKEHVQLVQKYRIVQQKRTIHQKFQIQLCSRDRNASIQFVLSLTQEYLESALNGYSVTIFAYGQTGSGKTYTMAGKEDKLSQEVFRSDENDGIIPRAIKNIWKYTQSRTEKYWVKASFTEIYNQQIGDLLNPSSGVLHCRWNPTNGFFVEDLVIVDCTSPEDLVAVLSEGVRNRKSGSHELNKDSSRSHSLMTVYLVSQTGDSDDRSVKKYGKISFVDLAGSERLKESKSQGQMAKQTGNINKSLFTLGKVIKSLSSKKTAVAYIPYRDSKLTMLLMDSLGGTSKALMVACVGPSATYFDETQSTLNYATRTMNIKNKPVVQMQEKDQVIYGLIRQRDLLRLQNQYLREQIDKSSQKKLQIPQFGVPVKSLPPLSKGNKSVSNKPISLGKPDFKKKFPGQYYSQGQKASQQGMGVSLYKIEQQYQFQIARIQKQNMQLRNGRQVAQKNYMIVLNDNKALQIKLQNLQQLYINNRRNQNINKQYMNTNLSVENKMIKDKIQQIEEQISLIQLNRKQNKRVSTQQREIQMINKNLKDRIEFLNKREMELKSLINQ